MKWNMFSTAAPTAHSNPKVIWSVPKEAAGPYNIPNVFIEEKIVYTNKIPCGHMRAPGDPQGFFANESQMDLIARQLKMDPVAFRKLILMRDGDISPIGHSAAAHQERRDRRRSGTRFRLSKCQTETFRPRRGHRAMVAVRR